MKKNNKAILIFFTIIVAVGIVACVFYVVLDTKGKINQGVFRANDVLVTSLVTVEEKQEKKEQSVISDLLLSLSQKNIISLLIPKESEINDIYIDNIKIKYPKKMGAMYLSQPSRQDKVELTEDMNQQRVNIYTEDKGNQYLVEIEINNADFATNLKVPEETKVVKFDGSLLSLTGINVEDIMFKLSFDLNIQDKSNKLSACNIDLKVPGYELANSGIEITRENLNDYVFYLKDDFSFNIKKYLKFL